MPSKVSIREMNGPKWNWKRPSTGRSIQPREGSARDEDASSLAAVLLRPTKLGNGSCSRTPKRVSSDFTPGDQYFWSRIATGCWQSCDTQRGMAYGSSLTAGATIVVRCACPEDHALVARSSSFRGLFQAGRCAWTTARLEIDLGLYP